MVKEVILNYIKENKEKGYTNEQLKGALLKAGYLENDVNEAFDELNSKNTNPNLNNNTQSSDLFTKSPDQLEIEKKVIGTNNYSVFKKRRPLVAALGYPIITLGIYFIYWFLSTNASLRKISDKTMSGWFILVPIANIILIWKFFKAISVITGKNNHTMLFFLYMFVSPATVYIVQKEINNLVEKK